MTKRLNQALWEKVKDEIKKGDKGGLPNTWSARKSQYAVLEYKRRGGKYLGKKDENNSLTKWTNENWDYISGNTGRYLPERVRKLLTEKEKKIENKLKGNKKGKKISYSESVLKKFRS